MGRVATDHYPVAVLHENGGLSANIYECVGVQGTYFTTTFSRIFEHKGKLYQTSFVREEHLLSLAQLAKRCHAFINRAERLNDKQIAMS